MDISKAFKSAHSSQLASSYFNVAKTLQSKGQLDHAISLFQKVCEVDPAFPGSYFHLGCIYREMGAIDDAIYNFEKAIKLDPKFSGSYVNLGNIYRERGLLDDAIEYYQIALSIDPLHIVALNNLGHVLQDKGQFHDAILCYKKALLISPERADTHSSLGNAYFNLGKLDKSEDFFRNALKIKPDFLYAYSYLLLSINCNPRYDGRSICFEHIKFAMDFAEPLYPDSPAYTNTRTGTRRLRIGYLSPDFKKHPVSFFIEPVLISHNRESFDIFCYSDVEAEDEVSIRMKKYVHKWQKIAHMSDTEVYDLIKKDEIDILVDLAGHTLRNRMLLFARKPAPVQVNWVGYPATTGLSSMDYKIVDQYTDPVGLTEHLYTEQLIRFPECFLCYLPDKDTPAVGELPRLSTGYITFGSFNNFAKISPEVFHLWTKILNSIPTSHLILKGKGFSDKTLCSSCLNIFRKEGINPDRIELLPPIPLFREHLNLYNRIDIGLDTFPYNGTTTTCEAMWMGVPVVTLAGNTHCSRVGTSLLSNIGLKDLSAKTQDEYIELATNLAIDNDRLQFLRNNLREMMVKSALCNVNRFITNLENCYRQLWNNWCKVI